MSKRKRETVKYSLAEFDAMDRALAVPKTKATARVCACCGVFLPRNCVPTTVVIAAVEHGPFCAACVGNEPTRYVTLMPEEQGGEHGMAMFGDTLIKATQAMQRGYLLLSCGVVMPFDVTQTAEDKAAHMAAMRATWLAGQPWPYQVYLARLGEKEKAA